MTNKFTNIRGHLNDSILFGIKKPVDKCINFVSGSIELSQLEQDMSDRVVTIRWQVLSMCERLYTRV